jgi:hypothetical protein
MSSSLWDGWFNPLTQAFPESTIIVPDRGYFGTNGSDWNSNEQWETDCSDATLIVCHSLGLHLVPSAALKQCYRLVVISGFRKFHDGTERDARRSRLVVQRMLSKAKTNLNEVLDEFYRNCGLKVPAGMTLTAMGADRLREDLSLLDKCNLSVDLSAPASQGAALAGGSPAPTVWSAGGSPAPTASDRIVLWSADVPVGTELGPPASLRAPNLLAIPLIQILHGMDDMIVSSDKADLLHNQLPNSRLTKLAGAGHALPFTHTQWCIEQIVNSFAPPEGALANAR